MQDRLIAKGKVEGVYIGSEEVQSVSSDKIIVEWNGIRGDRHYGRTKFAGVREKYLPKGSEMLNLRQISIVSKEELEEVAKSLNVAKILPEELGANILLSGVDDFTKIPYGAIMQFKHQVNLLLTGDNYPCILPGRELEKRVQKIVAIKFSKAAIHKRGLTAMVIKPGIIKLRDSFEIILPKETFIGINE